MKSWIKGGLIGFGIGILVILIIYTSIFIVPMDPAKEGIQKSIYYLRGNLMLQPCASLIGGGEGGAWSCVILINPLIWLSIFFIIGALIGMLKK